MSHKMFDIAASLGISLGMLLITSILKGTEWGSPIAHKDPLPDLLLGYSLMQLRQNQDYQAKDSGPDKSFLIESL